MPILIGFVWLLSAILGGWLGFLRILAPPFPHLVLVGLLALLLLAVFAVPAGRKWSASLPIDAILTLHLTRFVGFYFLYLYGQASCRTTLRCSVAGATSSLPPEPWCSSFCHASV